MATAPPPSNSATTRSKSGPPRIGRPRVHDDAAILSAAVESMAELGYHRMTLQDVARRSGVSAPSIYRRWKNKAEVVTAAVASVRPNRPEPTGDLRIDLIAQLRDIRWMYNNVTDIGLPGTLLTEESRHPEFIATWRKNIVGPRRRAVEYIVMAAQREGRASPDVDPAHVSQLVSGAYISARIAGQEVDDRWDEQVIDLILAGIRSRL